jgi:hypothetical protein
MQETATIIQRTAKKFPKFKRARGEKPALFLQPRDVEIVKLVYDHRFLDSDQIRALSDGSGQGISRRLQKLFHHGYLDRPPQQFTYASGNKKIIYALGNKGADILATAYGIDRARIDWRNKNYEAKLRYLDHTMMISNFRVCLTLALKEISGTDVIFWKQRQAGDLKDHVIVSDQSGHRIRLPINPDSFFGIFDSRIKNKEPHMYFFLEADRSTMTNARFLRKMRAYWLYYHQKKHIKNYNIKGFRVLTLTKSNQRADNLRQVTKQADERRQGSLMFWFTSEKSYELEDPGSILKAIWQTPVNDSRHHILE